MPKDQRLYMTFPNEFTRHPKITRLPVEVRWTFVEMNAEARMSDNDGVFTREEAEFHWPVEHLTALTKSHPTRPLVVVTDLGYVIREFAEHQQTRAEREQLLAKRVEAGRKGGLSRGQASAKHTPSPVKQSQAEKEKEQEKDGSSNEEPTGRKRPSRVPSSFTVTDAMRTWAAANAPHVDVDRKLPEWMDYWRGAPGAKGLKQDWVATWQNGMRKQEEFAIRDAGPAGPVKAKKQFVKHEDES